MAYPNLAAEMARQGITQEQVANVVGKTPQTISRWMTGKGKSGMPIELLFAIRDEFFPNMGIEYLGDPEPVEPGRVGARRR